MSERKPKVINGLFLCSGYDCPKFHSRVESGWGLYQTCFAWDEKECGKKPSTFPMDCECKPEIAMRRKQIGVMS